MDCAVLMVTADMFVCAFYSDEVEREEQFLRAVVCRCRYIITGMTGCGYSTKVLIW